MQTEIIYKYCQEYGGTRESLTKTWITYDPIKDRLFSSQADLSHCSYRTATFDTQQLTFVWSPTNEDFCETLKSTKILNKGKMTIHYNENNEHVRAEIDELLMSFPSTAPIPRTVPTCFTKSEIIQTPQGIILEIINCTQQGTTQFLRERLQKQTLKHSAIKETRELTYMLNYLYDTVSKSIKENMQQNNFLNCKNDELHAFFLKEMSKTQPSKVLSKILNRKVGAIARNDMIVQIACRNITAELRNSLKLRNVYASRPIANVLQNESYLIQLYEEGIWIAGTPFKENFKENSEMTFNIQGEWITYRNYSKTATRKIPTKLTPESTKMNVPLKELDFSSVDVSNGKLVENTQNAYIESAISNGILQNNLGQLTMGNAKRDNINVENTLVETMLNIKGQSVITLITITHVLSMIWNAIYPCLILYCCIQYVNYKRKGRVPNAYDDKNTERPSPRRTRASSHTRERNSNGKTPSHARERDSGISFS